MKVLNLVYPEKSEIKFHDGLGNIGKTAKFPDGQQNIVLLSDNDSYEDSLYILKHHNIGVQIKSRLNNWLNLELIVCAVASLRKLGVEEIHLYVPYFLGARSDRDFTEGNGGNNYLKDVICPVINSLNFKTVTCIDPHSDVLEACIKGFRKATNEGLVRFALDNIVFGTKTPPNYILISPDAGASKKIYKIAEQIGYKGDIITCSKDRDENGKLTKTIVPVTFEQLKSEKDFIIIDDICDGGATFINIAKAIKDERKSAKIYLIVTHGIFSSGLKELHKYFNGIYCTNSYKGITNTEFDGINTKDYKGFLTQLNLF